MCQGQRHRKVRQTLDSYAVCIWGCFPALEFYTMYSFVLYFLCLHISFLFFLCILQHSHIQKVIFISTQIFLLIQKILQCFLMLLSHQSLCFSDDYYAYFASFSTIVVFKICGKVSQRVSKHMNLDHK